MNKEWLKEDYEFLELNDKYWPIQAYVYEKALEVKPKVIVEFGFGWGGVTVALASAIKKLNNGGRVYSYDNLSYTPEWNANIAYNALNDRGLTQFVELNVGDVFDLYFKNPFNFDFLMMDFANTPERLHQVMNHDFIKKQRKDGAYFMCEGGAEAHPRVNSSIVNEFNKSVLYEEQLVLSDTVGDRVSVSVINLVGD